MTENDIDEIISLINAMYEKIIIYHRSGTGEYIGGRLIGSIKQDVDTAIQILKREIE